MELTDALKTLLTATAKSLRSISHPL